MYKLFVVLFLAMLLSACGNDSKQKSGADNPPIINFDDREETSDEQEEE